MTQAWEYKTLVFSIDGRKLTLHEDNVQLPGGATPVSRAPELGAQGWELVSATGFVTRSESSDRNQYGAIICVLVQAPDVARCCAPSRGHPCTHLYNEELEWAVSSAGRAGAS